MKAAILGLFAETSIHPGAGSSVGVVDLPVAREAATDYPVLAGSSLKGALRDRTETLWVVEGIKEGLDEKAAREKSQEKARKLFGDQEAAGSLLISDGRLLLLPVRSLTGAYRWVTCPHLLERLSRDLRRAGLHDYPGFEASIDSGHAVLREGQGHIFLEEREFTISRDKEKIEKLAEPLKRLLLHESSRDRLGSQLAILADRDFAWFARYGLSVQARNVLDDNTKQSKNLWYEETLPPDTLMYTLWLGRTDSSFNLLNQILRENPPYLQVGGNETVGQGWFAVTVYKHANGDLQEDVA